MSVWSQCPEQTIQNMIFSSAFSLALFQRTCQKEKKKRKKKYYLFIKHSSGLPLPLDIYSKCHFWYSALFKGNKNSKKPLLGGKRTTGSLSTTFSHTFCRCMRSSTSRLRQRLKVNPCKITQQVIWYGHGGGGVFEERELKKKVTEFVSECVIVRVCVCVCCTLTLIDQMESSRAGLAFGGKADEDLVGGC